MQKIHSFHLCSTVGDAFLQTILYYFFISVFFDDAGDFYRVNICMCDGRPDINI